MFSELTTFSIPYTSGTTGRPKGVMLSHRSRALAFHAFAAEYSFYSPDDRFLAIAPLCHGAGLAFAMTSIFVGGTCEILPRFDAQETLEKLSNGLTTGVFLVPTHFHAFFELEDTVLDSNRSHALRGILSNAAPLSQSSKEQIVDYFGDGLLHETYGSTEAGVVTNLRPSDQLRKEQCAGLPFQNTQVRVLDDDKREVAPGVIGELYSRSPYLFNGYWQRPEETEAAIHHGWFSAGDLATRDEEGYLYIVGRKKDMVISGGVNIYPREIEEVLIKQNSVIDAAVVGVPDEKWGERLVAYVASRGADNPSNAELEQYCSDRLSAYKVPREFILIDELPRNHAGKVLKHELQARYKNSV